MWPFLFPTWSFWEWGGGVSWRGRPQTFSHEGSLSPNPRSSVLYHEPFPQHLPAASWLRCLGATALEAPWGAVSRSGLGRCWQASGVVPCACPGPRAPRRRPPQLLLPVPPPPCLKPLPTPGMSFAYHIPCLLPSKEGAPLHLSPPPPHPLVTWAHGTLIRLILKPKKLLHSHPEAPGKRPYGWYPS